MSVVLRYLYYISSFRNILGSVLESFGEFEASAECLTTVVQLEATNPIVPFSVIHKVLQ